MTTPAAPPPFEPENRLADAPVIRQDMLAAADESEHEPVDFERGMALAPVLTLIFIALNVIVFGVELATGALKDAETIKAAGALTREAVVGGEGWRLFTAVFLHGGWDHLIGNCLILYVLGMACEHAFGVKNMGIIYLVAGLMGSMLSIVLTTGPSVGASGAIFGVMGAVVIFFRNHGKEFALRDNRVGIVLAVWALYSIVTAFFQPFIDNGAHMGGLLGGLIAGYFLRPEIIDRVKPFAASAG
jgi:rhomboid protease GluP